MGKYTKNQSYCGFPSGSYAKISRYLLRSLLLPIMFKKCRDSIKGDVTLAEIQSASERYHNLTLIGNCQTF